MKDNAKVHEEPSTLSPKVERLISEFPQPILDSFTPDQKTAVIDALGANHWRRHPIDIRQTIPFPGGPYYIALVMGKERRNPGRLENMRDKHPLYTTANTIFSIILAAIFTVGMTTIGMAFLFAIGRIIW